MTLPWERPAARIGGPDTVEALAAMPGSELTALLLEVAARRQRRVRPAEVARRYAEDAFVVASSVDQRTFIDLDAWMLSRVPRAFDAVELSPLAPLGTVAALGPVHPNCVIPTFRATEVLSDSTNVLALEAAGRRDSADVVRLCTSHRVVRTQRVAEPWHTQHFRLFTLVTAGRDPGGRTFETEALLEQLRVWLALLGDLPPGYRAEAVGLVVAWDARFDAVAAALHTLPIPVRRDEERLQRSSYYQGLAYKLEVRTASGAILPLGDGGFVDWAAKLRQDRKERLLISAVGTEGLVKTCR